MIDRYTWLRAEVYQSNSMYKFIGASFFSLLLAFNSTSASTGVARAGNALTLGSANYSHGMGSSIYNPAAPAASAELPTKFKREMGLSFSGGLEYGNVDNIFMLIDLMSDVINGEEPGDGSIPPDLPDEPVNLPSNPTFQDILDQNPEFARWWDAVQSQATFFASATAIIAEETYAKSQLYGTLPIHISNDKWGGAVTLELFSFFASKARGGFDSFEFDQEVARNQLEAAKKLPPDTTETVFALSDDFQLIVNPSENSANLKITNDSLLLIKGANISGLSFNYSREFFRSEEGALFFGLKPKIYWAGLAFLDTRFAELSDSEKLFDDIRETDYRYSSRLGLDIGAMWVSSNLAVGITANDVTGAEFSFPSFDRERYWKVETIRKLTKESTYKIDPLLRFDASLFSGDGGWSVNTQIDMNEVGDIFGDDYQWFVIAGAYQSSKKWMPNLRLGYRSNLSNDGLEYLSAGATVFDVLSVDVSTTLDSVKINGSNTPRGAAISLGLNFRY